VGAVTDKPRKLANGCGKIAKIVENGSAELGIDLPSGAGAEFEEYYIFLDRQSRTANLTAITGPEEVALRHFLDSIALLKPAQMKNARVIDIGSGAGFPGIPMKLVEKTIKLTLLDATNKRVRFMSELCATLGVEAECIHARAEEAAHDLDKRERFDVAVSRAVAKMGMLCELCLPFVCVGGFFIAMKGADSTGELDEAQNAIKTLGGKFKEWFVYTIPGTDIVHSAAIIQKISPTPEKYPRRFARIQKNPL